MTHSTTLFNAQQGRQSIDKLWEWAKPRLLYGDRLTLTISEEKRSDPQNRMAAGETLCYRLHGDDMDAFRYRFATCEGWLRMALLADKEPEP